MRLDGKVAVITGSTRGWGKAIAQSFSQAGASVVINGRRSDTVDSVVDEIRATGGQAAGVALNVSTLANARAIIQTAVETFGRLDIIVNNAGVKAESPLLETSEAHWDEAIATELKGVFTCTKAAVEQMVSQGSGGRVINMGGAAGLYGSPGDAHHAAAKAGVIVATLSWAQELLRYGITVNAVRAGVRSELASPVIQMLRQKVKDSNQPVPESDRDLGFFEPEEATPLVTWLVSDEARDVTGWFLGIDGPRITVWEPTFPQRSVFCEPAWTVQSIGRFVAPLLHRSTPWRTTYDLLLSPLLEGLDLGYTWGEPTS